MRDYGQVQCHFWQSTEVQGFSDVGKLLALYLLTGPHSNGIGCYRLPDGYIMADLGWSSETVSKGFRELIQTGFVYRCEQTQLVLIPKFLRWNQIANPKIAAARLKELNQIPKSSPIYDMACWCLAAFGGPHVPSDFVSLVRELKVKLTARVPRETREFVFERDGHACVFCSSKDDLTLDHIRPRALGGDHSADNLRTMCRKCNSSRPIFEKDTVSIPLDDGLGTVSIQEQERRGTKPNLTTCAEKPKTVSSAPTIPLDDGTEYEVPEDLFAELAAAYPDISVLEQLHRCRAWNLSNPKKRKTRAGVKRHLNEWLSRAQKDATANGAAKPAEFEGRRWKPEQIV